MTGLIICLRLDSVVPTLRGLKLLILIAGEAYYSSEAKDAMTDRKSVFAIDGVTDRADCDATYDLDNANKLNLIPVSWLSERNTYQYITVDYFTRHSNMWDIVCQYGMCCYNSVVSYH